MADIICLKGDITRFLAQAIVNPSNSHGLMGGGVALHIRTAGGQSIEDEAILGAPIPVGRAIHTTAGYLPSKWVIHASTMKEPAEKAKTRDIAAATKAALKKACELKVESLAFPGMGCGVGGLSYPDAASTMADVIINYDPPFTVYLIGFDDELTREFERWTRNQNQRT